MKTHETQCNVKIYELLLFQIYIYMLILYSNKYKHNLYNLLNII